MVTENQIRSLGQTITKSASVKKSLNTIFQESIIDIFISHAYPDKDMIKGLKIYFEREMGLSVFVDWDNDYIDLDRNNISEDTAKAIKHAIAISKAFIYVHSENSIVSRWNKWELGYADGKQTKLLGIFPLEGAPSPKNSQEEFLAIYPTGPLSIK